MPTACRQLMGRCIPEVDLSPKPKEYFGNYTIIRLQQSTLTALYSVLINSNTCEKYQSLSTGCFPKKPVVSSFTNFNIVILSNCCKVVDSSKLLEQRETRLKARQTCKSCQQAGDKQFPKTSCYNLLGQGCCRSAHLLK